MKQYVYRFMVVTAMACGGWLAEAVASVDVPQQAEEQVKEIPDPEKMARKKTDDMNEALTLSEKQYKKIYKLYLKQEKERLKVMADRRPSEEGRPPMPPRGGGMHQRGEGMHVPMRFGKREDMQEQMEKFEKKLKKILTGEQYATWSARQPKEEKHEGHPRTPENLIEQ